MTIKTNSLEGGTNGTTVTSGNSGGTSGDAFNTVTGTVTFDNTHPKRGSLGIKFVSSASVSDALWTGIGSVATLWFRRYVYITANPAATTRLVTLQNSAGSLCGSISLTTAGKLIFLDSAGSTITGMTSTNTVPLNAQFRIEGFLTASATVGQVEFKLFTTPDSVTPTETKSSTAAFNTNTNIDRIAWGQQVAVTFTDFMDDPAISTTGYLGPSTISGTGSVSIHKMGLSSSGVEKDTGTGSVALKKMTLSGSGIDKDAGTGSVKLKKMALSGSGKAKDVATGSVALKKMRISGSGVDKDAGTGSVRLKKMLLSGSGKEKDAGTGSVALKKMRISGSGIEKDSGTGSVRLHKLGLAGTGVRIRFSYKTWPSTNGPSSPANDTSQYIFGRSFKVTADCLLFAYRWWVATGQSVAAEDFGLYAVNGFHSGTFVAGSKVTSGAFTTGQWNIVACSTPILLTAGQEYRAVKTINKSGGAVKGYSATSLYWDTGGPGEAGIVNEPLVTFAKPGAAVNPEPSGDGQMVFFAVASPDVANPAHYPSNQFNSANYWFDVVVTPLPGAGAVTMRKMRLSGSAANLGLPKPSSLFIFMPA